MNSNEIAKGKEKDTGSEGASSIENADMTTAATAWPVTNSFTSISTSSKLKHAKKMAEMAKATLAEDVSNEDATEFATPVNSSIPSPALKAGETSKKPKSHAPRNVYDKPDILPRDFPDEKAALTNDQIRKLITQGPSFRKSYSNYFASNGNIRRQYYDLIFERLPSGDMRYPENILASNLPSRSDTIQRRIQKREESEVSGKHIRKKAKIGKKNEASEEISEPEENQNAPKPMQKNSAAAERESFLTSVLMPLSDNLSRPTLQGPAATVPAVTSEVRFPQPSRETGPPYSHLYRSRSRSGSIRPSGDSVASPPVSSVQNNLSGPLVRGRSRSPRRNLTASASQTSTAGAALGSTCHAKSPSAASVDSAVSAASITGPDRPMRGNPFGPRNGERKAPSGENKPRPYDPAHVQSTEHDSIRRCLDNDIVPFIQRYEAGDMDLMAMDGLERSVAWIHQEVHKLNVTLSAACETSTNLQFKITVNDLIMRLLALQKSCWMLQEQLKKRTMET